MKPSLFFVLWIFSFSKIEARVEAHLVVNAQTGAVLASNNADTLTPPASLTKMMTAFLVFKALDRGEITFVHKIPISKFAASQAPCNLGVRPGQTLTVREAILAINTRSANDVSEAIAEFMGRGNRHKFYRMMNEQAKQLGLRRTTFGNASGLPHHHNWTTARDMAVLGLALQRHFPHHFHFFGVKYFKYKSQIIRNHNNMLGVYDGINGIKTGLTDKSGSNIVTSCVRSGKRLVGVVLGGSNWRVRNAKMGTLLDEGFDKLHGRAPTPKSDPMFEQGGQFKKVKAILGKSKVAPLSQDLSAKWVVKLQSFQSKEKARDYALKLVKRYPRYFRDKTAALEHIKGKKGKTYRPKIMHFTAAQGQSFCAALRAGGQTCLLIENKQIKTTWGLDRPTFKKAQHPKKKPLKSKGSRAKKRPARR